MQSFPDRSAWQRHISYCASQYLGRQKTSTALACPLSCPELFQSETDLWHHLEDCHSTPAPQVGTKRKAAPDNTSDETARCVRVVKRRRGSKLSESTSAQSIHIPALDISPTPAVPTDFSSHSTPFSSLSYMDLLPGTTPRTASEHWNPRWMMWARSSVIS
jgi:hypothetical protein